MYSVSCLSVNGQWTVLFVIPEQRLFITFKGNLYRIVIAMAIQQFFNLGISVLLFYFLPRKFLTAAIAWQTCAWRSLGRRRRATS